MPALEWTCESLKRRLDEGQPVTLIDCRETWEHELVALPDSTLIPMNDTPARVEEYRAKPGPIVVYCHHGVRSMNVVHWLRNQGVEDVWSLSGGIDHWSLTVDPDLPRY